MSEENVSNLFFREDNQVVKANKLIEAKGKLSLIEQKLFASLISEITPDDEDFKYYEIKISDIAEFMDRKSKSIYDDLKVASSNLRKKEIVIQEKNSNGKSEFLITGLLSSARYQEGEGKIKFRIDPDLKPYLLAINGENTPFTKYQLVNILKLSSSYSIRIYELLKQYLKIRKRTFEINELRSFLGIEDKYNRFEAFERRVLKVAVKEINEYTDINIDYKKNRNGRRVTHIEFSIQPSTVDKQTEILERLYDDKEYKQLVENMNLSDKKISRKQIFELYEIACKKTDYLDVNVYNYVKFNVAYVEKKKPINYFAYLKKALEGDFGNAIVLLKLVSN